MLKDFNLLITTARGNEENVCSEIWYLLGELGDSAVVIDKTGITGLVAAKTFLNPFEVIEKLRVLLKERPYEFRYTLRVIPIEKVVRTIIEDIEKTSAELSSKIKEKETFRVSVEKRFSELPTEQIVEVVAANIERKVSLEKSDKIVLIEVVGKFTGMSIIKPLDIFSVSKERIG
jgi:tRNA acetyltransferase TAN1